MRTSAKTAGVIANDKEGYQKSGKVVPRILIKGCLYGVAHAGMMADGLEESSVTTLSRLLTGLKTAKVSRTRCPLPLLLSLPLGHPGW